MLRPVCFFPAIFTIARYLQANEFISSRSQVRPILVLLISLSLSLSLLCMIVRARESMSVSIIILDVCILNSLFTLFSLVVYAPTMPEWQKAIKIILLVLFLRSVEKKSGMENRQLPHCRCSFLQFPNKRQFFSVSSSIRPAKAIHTSLASQFWFRSNSMVNLESTNSVH